MQQRAHNNTREILLKKKLLLGYIFFSDNGFKGEENEDFHVLNKMLFKIYVDVPSLKQL